VRRACRDTFYEYKLLERILPDIDYLLGISSEGISDMEADDDDPARPEPLWSPPELINRGESTS